MSSAATSTPSYDADPAPTASHPDWFTPLEKELLVSLKHRQASCFDRVRQEELNTYKSETKPRITAADSNLVQGIARQRHAEAPSCSRLVVTKPRVVHDFRTGKRVDLRGHISFHDRIFTNNLPRKPTYTPLEGDDIRFFMEILLRFLPLCRVRHVRKGSTGKIELPNNAQILKFHRDYSKEIYRLLEGRYELWRWRQVFIRWLNKKIPQNGANHFKWMRFWMTSVEIECAVTEAVYHYGMERMGNP